MKLWKAAAAALAMMAGSVPASAAYIVYTITGYGTQNRTEFGDGARPEVNNYVNVIASFSVNLDLYPEGGGVSQLQGYNAIAEGNSVGARIYDVTSDRGAPEFDISSRGSIYYSQGFGFGNAVVTGRETINAVATAYSFRQSNVLVDSFVVQVLGPVPEPATWAMMMLGFGFVGAGLRSRRRAVSYSLA